MKEWSRRLATGEMKIPMGSCGKPPPPTPPAQNGGTIGKLYSKDDLKEYFDNLAAAATNGKSVLDQLATVIASITTNN